MPDHDVTKPLQVRGAYRDTDPLSCRLEFDRPPTANEIERLGSLPPSYVVASDLRSMIERAMLMELALRVLRTYVLAGVEMPEGPSVVRWIKDWMSGTNPPHGPLGGRMIWPSNLMGLCSLIRDWGYEPTEQTRDQPSFVTRKLSRPGTEKPAPAPSTLILNR